MRVFYPPSQVLSGGSVLGDWTPSHSSAGMQYMQYITTFLFQTFALFWMLYAFFCVIPRRLNFICRRGTLSHLQRQVDMKSGWVWECWKYLYGKRFGSKIAWTKLFPINTPTFSNPVTFHTHLPMKTEQTERSETSAYKIQTPVNYPEESIHHITLLFIG
jgi:hypothetical protein